MDRLLAALQALGKIDSQATTAPVLVTRLDKHLTAEYQKIITEEAKRWGASALKANVDGADKIFADIKAKGVTVVTPDKAPFREAVKAVHQELGLTPMVAEVQAALKK